MNKHFKISYRLYTLGEEGKQELVERTSPERPMQFISGLGMVLDGFESNVADLTTGDEFDFTIPCAEAYGDYSEEHVVKIPRENFTIDGHFDADHIFPGADIPLVNEDGTRFDGLVKEVGTDEVTIDLNHPLAGQDLLFKGSIIECHEATPEEIQGALNLMSGEGCSCGCDHDGHHDCDCHGNHDCGCHHH